LNVLLFEISYTIIATVESLIYDEIKLLNLYYPGESQSISFTCLLSIFIYLNNKSIPIVYF